MVMTQIGTEGAVSLPSKTTSPRRLLRKRRRQDAAGWWLLLVSVPATPLEVEDLASRSRYFINYYVSWKCPH